MATVTKRVGKKGVSYLVQVKIRDKGSGKRIIKSSTWHAPSGITQYQIKRELDKYASEYETRVREQEALIDLSKSRKEITFKAYAGEWLDRVKLNHSLKYYTSCKDSIEYSNKHIGGYKLRELNPSIIQRFFDKIDARKKIVTQIVVKPRLRKLMRETGIGYMKLTDEYGISNSTLCHMLQYKQVSIETAKSVADIFKKEVEELFNVRKLVTSYAHETNGQIKRTVRAILSVAKKQRLVKDNYATADFINFPKKPHKEIVCYEGDQVGRFYKAIMEEKDIRIKTSMLTLLSTGVRRGELCGLEWKDIDFDKSTITIARSVITVKGYGVITKEPKTEASKRTISIPQVLVNQLMKYKEWKDKYKMEYGDLWFENDRLFTRENGERIHPSSLRRWLKIMLRGTELPFITIHSLRHTAITFMIMEGVPMAVVSGRAGHAKISTTSDIYTHFTKAGDQQASDRLDNAFSQMG